MGSLTQSSQTTKAQPWGPTANLLRQGYKDLSGAYSAMGDLPRTKKGALKSNDFIFTEPTTAALGQDSTAALGGMRDVAAANSNGAGMSGHLQSIMSDGGMTGGQKAAVSGFWDLSNNGMLNSLIDSKNGFTGEQDKAYQGLQGAVANNNANLQGTFDAGGFDAKQNAAYDALNNKTTSNNSVLQGTFDNGGMTADQAGAMAGMKDSVNQANANFQGTINQGGLTADQRAVQDRNRGIMGSSFDLNSNPAYAGVRQNALDTQSDALSARAAAAGRYGGGMDQAILAREQGKLGNSMDDAEYRRWQAQTDQASRDLYAGDQQGTNNQVTLGQAQRSGLGDIAALGQTALGNQLGINSAQQAGLEKVVGAGQAAQGNKLAQNSAIQQGYGGVIDAGGQGVSQNSNAIGQKQGLLSSIFNAEQASIGNMGAAYDTAMKPSQTQAQVGQAYDQQTQNIINDKMRMFDAANPVNNINNYLATLSGAPKNSVTTANTSPLQTMLGAGIGGYGLLSAMKKWGAAPVAA